MTESQRTVALLIDYDNLQICYSRDAPGTQLDLGAVVALAQSYGQLVVARAYAEWNLLSERLAVYKAGLDPVFAPVLRPEGSNREGKSLADTVMVSEGVDILWTFRPDVLVLVTSDKDMVPLARLAKQRGVLVVVLGSDLTAVQLLEMANDFVTYRHLIRELGRPEERLLPHQVREEPRLRRGRESAGVSREVAAAREASLREPRTFPRRRPLPEQPPSLPVPLRTETPAPAPLIPAQPEPPAIDMGTAQLEELAQPINPRRRRRRGGRGRRTGEGVGEIGQTEGLESADSAPESGVVGSLEAVESTVQETAAEPGPARIAPAPIGEVGIPPEPPARRAPRGRRRPERPTPTLAGQSPSVEPAPLKPWERWPESPSSGPDRGVPGRAEGDPSPGEQATPPTEAAPAETPAAARSASAELAPLPAEVPAPSSAASFENGSSVETARETVASEAGPAGENGSSDEGSSVAAPAPARRRRPRRPTKPKTDSAVVAGEAE